ncbi:hypothetical protein VTI74DRAFT_9847 [Chaetomium olivicolor]
MGRSRAAGRQRCRTGFGIIDPITTREHCRENRRSSCIEVEDEHLLQHQPAAVSLAAPGQWWQETAVGRTDEGHLRVPSQSGERDDKPGGRFGSLVADGHLCKMAPEVGTRSASLCRILKRLCYAATGFKACWDSPPNLTKNHRCEPRRSR